MSILTIVVVAIIMPVVGVEKKKLKNAERQGLLVAAAAAVDVGD